MNKQVAGFIALACLIGAPAWAGQAPAADANNQTAQPDPLPPLASQLYTQFCEDLIAAPNVSRSTYRLNEQARLVLLPCYEAAYNSGAMGFIANENGRWVPLYVSVMTINGWHASPYIPRPRFNQNTATLRTYHKARGPGDCGVAGEYSILADGAYMRAYWHKPVCDGNVFETTEETLIYEADNDN